MSLLLLIFAGALHATEPDAEKPQVRLSNDLEQGLIVGKLQADQSKTLPAALVAPAQPPLTARIVDGVVVISHDAEPADELQESEQEQ